MNGKLMFADVVLQNNVQTTTLIDEGCQCYAAIHEDLVEGLGLQYVAHERRTIKGASAAIKNSKSTGVVGFRMDMAGFSQIVYAYVVPDLLFPIILGNPWKTDNSIRTAPDKARFYHGRAKKYVQESERESLVREDSGPFFTIAATTASDIEKTLKPKKELTEEDLKNRLPPELHDMLPLFFKRKAEELAPRREGIDHKIEIRAQADGTPTPLP